MTDIVPKSELSRLEKARIAIEQAQARYDAIAAREKATDRKIDARRKIILGAGLIHGARHDEQFAAVLAEILKRLDKPNDRKPFEGWEAPKP